MKPKFTIGDIVLLSNPITHIDNDTWIRENPLRVGKIMNVIHDILVEFGSCKSFTYKYDVEAFNSKRLRCREGELTLVGGEQKWKY